MTDQNHASGYPTNEQIEEMWNAWKAYGEEGIKEVLEKRRQEREHSKSANENHPK